MAGEDENPYTRPVRPGEAPSAPAAYRVPPADAAPRTGGAEPPPPPEGPRRRSRTLPLLVAVLALAGFGAIVWYAYTWGTGEVPPEELPVVAADRDLTAVKEKPEEPGGMDVPHQDAEVLNERAGETAASQEAGEVERLLPRPEAPQPPEPEPAASEPVMAEEGAATSNEAGDLPSAPPAPPAVSPPLSEVAPPAEEAETPPTEPAEATQEEPAAVEVTESPVVAPGEVERAEPQPADTETAESPPPPAAPEADAEATPEPEAASQTASDATPAPAPQTAALPPSAQVQSGDWVLQLAALREMPAIEAEWGRLRAKHPDLLGSLSLATQSVETDSGTFIRLQAGPLPNRATAEDLCGLLQARGTDCLIKRH